MMYHILLFGAYFILVMIPGRLAYQAVSKKYSFLDKKFFVSYLSIILSYIAFIALIFDLNFISNAFGLSVNFNFIIMGLFLPCCVAVYFVILIWKIIRSLYKGSTFMNDENKFYLNTFLCFVLILILSIYISENYLGNRTLMGALLYDSGPL